MYKWIEKFMVLGFVGDVRVLGWIVYWLFTIHFIFCWNSNSQIGRGVEMLNAHSCGCRYFNPRSHPIWYWGIEADIWKEGSAFDTRKKWRGTRTLHVDMTFSKKLPRVSDGFRVLVWWVHSSAYNLTTVVQTVRRKLHTTLNNICTVLTLTGIELGTLKSPYIQSVMLTFVLYHRSTQTFLESKNQWYFAYILKSVLTTLQNFELFNRQ